MLRARMAALGMTQSDTAVALGVSPTTLSRWVRDKDAPHVSRVEAVAHWLGVPLLDLLSVIHESATAEGAADRVDEALQEVRRQQAALVAEVAELRALVASMQAQP